MNGRLKILIKAIPSNTPGMKNGNHATVAQTGSLLYRRLVIGRQVANLRPGRLIICATNITTVAATAANQKEFQIAPVPASTAPVNSDHVRFDIAICASGKAKDNAPNI